MDHKVAIRTSLPTATLPEGTSREATRLTSNCQTVFNFPHEVRVNTGSGKSLGLQDTGSEGSAGPKLKALSGLNSIQARSAL